MSQTILLIEDNADMSENIADILRLAHYQVTIANNGKVGVDIAQKTHPDLIICDIMMPELDGYGVVHILKSDPSTADIPFIFLTAKAEKKDFRAGMNQGADDYISKPFDGNDLLKVVEVQLKKNKLLKSSLDNSNGAFQNKTSDFREFQKLVENKAVRLFKKKHFLFMEGQHPNDLYYINQGSVKSYKVNYDGKELITGIHRAGDFVGYVPLLENKPYSDNAEALEESKISIINKDEFLDLVYSSREVAQKFIKMLSKDLEETESRLLDIAYQSVRQRVAIALLKINEQFAKTSKDSVITVARKDISNIVGTATESLNRTLADFKDEGLVEIMDEGLKIKNKVKLEALVH
jgi:CRP-like cAMP-binding protein/CheY-like chemotaxis protein